MSNKRKSQNSNSDNLILNIAGVISLIGVTRATFNRLRDTEDFPKSINTAGRSLWSKASIMEWLNARKCN